MSPGEGQSRGVSNMTLKTQLEGLGKNIDEVKNLLVSYEERIRCLERAGDKTQPLIENRIAQLEKTSEEHKQELKDLTALINTQAQSVEKLKNGVDSMQRIWKWGLGIFTVVITAVIIMLVTGQATVIFR
jgi:predicted RNase H-like nuclease (RuvC/YqgF family)